MVRAKLWLRDRDAYVGTVELAKGRRLLVDIDHDGYRSEVQQAFRKASEEPRLRVREAPREKWLPQYVEPFTDEWLRFVLVERLRNYRADFTYYW
jgi:hypothetical protein